MNTNPIRVGIVGLGGNCRLRHVPGLRACPQVDIVAICNRRKESTAEAAREFGIPKSYERWQDLVADKGVDAVVIGTWPYLHCPITLAALQAGKHVLTEARMAMNAAEAHAMLDASRKRPELVTQIVPSPFGLRVHNVVRELLGSNYLGELREVVVIGTSDALALAATPLQWRQVAELSGVNTLTLGILHETLVRWVPDPTRVFAQATAFTSHRSDPATGMRCEVGTADSLQAVTEIGGGARGIYHFSGVTRFGPGSQIHLYGSEGTLKVELLPVEKLLGARRGESELHEIKIPAEKELSWRVEAEFIDAIRGDGRIQFTDFATGVRYMEFTEAVARSAESGLPVDLPLTDRSD
jgi:predicted dehydrogenase